jgi:hypothetical protein
MFNPFQSKAAAHYSGQSTDRLVGAVWLSGCYLGLMQGGGVVTIACKLIIDTQSRGKQ